MNKYYLCSMDATEHLGEDEYIVVCIHGKHGITEFAISVYRRASDSKGSFVPRVLVVNLNEQLRTLLCLSCEQCIAVCSENFSRTVDNDIYSKWGTL